jgi:hypothetical protein
MIEFCTGCEKKHNDYFWKSNGEGWWCSKWYKPTHKYGIRDRALRPDGSVATGQEAEKIRDMRLRMQSAKTR